MVRIRDSESARATRNERRQACSVVGNSRRHQTLAVALHANIRARWKNGVQMSGDENDALAFQTRAFANHISELVGADRKAARGQEFLERLAARAFSKLRRGNLRQANVLVGNPRRILFEPLQAGRAARIIGNLPNRIPGRCWRKICPSLGRYRR